MATWGSDLHSTRTLRQTPTSISAAHEKVSKGGGPVLGARIGTTGLLSDRFGSADWPPRARTRSFLDPPGILLQGARASLYDGSTSSSLGLARFSCTSVASGSVPTSARSCGATPRSLPSSPLAASGRASQQSGANGNARGSTSSAASSCRQLSSSPRRGRGGGLDLLLKEPQAHVHREEAWLSTRQPSERSLRKALRLPLPEHGEELKTPREVQLRERAGRLHELYSLMDTASQQLAPESPVLEAARRRVERLQGLSLPPEASRQSTASSRHESLRPLTAETAASVSTPRALTVLAVSKQCSVVSKPTLRQPVLNEVPYSSRSNSLGMRALGELRYREWEAFCCNHLDVHADCVATLAKHLSRDVNTEQERAWMAFCWTCHHVRSTPTDTAEREFVAEQVLELREASGRGFAELFRAICAELEVRVDILTGRSRIHGSALDGGTQHVWNLAYLDGRRSLVDCYQGAGSIRGIRPHFFGAQPAELTFTHLPSKDHWQLLDPPIGRKTFGSQPCLRTDIFFEHGMVFWPDYRPNGIIALERVNTGFIGVRAAHDVDLMATLDGEATACYISDRRREQQKIAAVHVSVLSAQNLEREVPPAKGSKPYCVLHVREKGTKLKTKTVAQSSSNPRWDADVVLDDCCVSDVLEFRVYDEGARIPAQGAEDARVDDDLLGFVALPIARCLQESRFEGELKLSETGLPNAAATVHVRVKLSGLVPQEPAEESADIFAKVYFRAPRGDANRRLEVSARRGRADFAFACAFTVAVRGDFEEEFIEPEFPAVDWNVCRMHNFYPLEMRPQGTHILTESNVIEQRFHAPEHVQVVANVDGDATACLVQRVREIILVWALCPLGDHELSVSIRSGELGPYSEAMKYKLTALPSCIFSKDGFPRLLGLFHQLGARLEEPKEGVLRPGPRRFSVCVDEAHVARVVVRCADGTNQPLAAKGEGRFEGTPHVRPPDALLLCGQATGNLEAIARFNVVPTGDRMSLLVRRESLIYPATRAVVADLDMLS